MGSKVRPWQLMRQSTPLALYGERKGYEGVRWVTVVGWCCYTHAGYEVSSCVVKRLPSLCVMQCGLVGLFVGFRWPVNAWLRVGVLEAQDGGAVGVAWPFPSGLASGPLRAFSEHFRF